MLVHVSFGSGRCVGHVGCEGAWSEAREVDEPVVLDGIGDSAGHRREQSSVTVGHDIGDGVAGSAGAKVSGVGAGFAGDAGNHAGAAGFVGVGDVPEIVGLCGAGAS